MPFLAPYPGVASGAGQLRGSNNTLLMQRPDVDPIPSAMLMTTFSGLEGQATPPPTGDHAHFDSVVASPNNWLAGQPDTSLRSTQSIDDWANDPSRVFERWAFDPSMDAARLRFDVGQNMNLGSAFQIFFDFAPIKVVEDQTTFSLQYETMYGPTYLDLSLSNGWGGIMKTVRCDFRGRTAGTDDRQIEFNNQTQGGFVRDYCADPRWRVYVLDTFHSAYDRNYPYALKAWDDEGNLPSPPIPDQDRQPSIRTGLDYQRNAVRSVQDHYDMVAGATNRPFLHKNGIWTRVTMEWRYVGDGDVRWRVWMADEETDPIVVISQKDTGDGRDGDGINLYRVGSIVYPGVPGSGGKSLGDYVHDNSIDRVRIEENSSTAGNGVFTAYDKWYRNFVIWRGATIPLGGRPMKTV